MADRSQILLDKTAAASSTEVIKGTTYLEDITVQVELTEITGVGTQWQVFIDTTNADSSKHATAAYWTNLWSFTQKVTGDAVPFISFKTLVDDGAKKELGAFIKVRVVIAGASADVDYIVRWTYKIRP